MDFLKDKKNKIIIAAAVLAIIAVVSAVGISKKKQEEREKAALEASKKAVVELYYEDKFDDSIKEIEKVLAKEEEKTEWNLKMAKSYSLKGEVEKSNEYIEKIQKDENLDGDTMNEIVLMNFFNEENDKAIKNGEQGLKDFPDNNKIQQTMILVYMNNNMIDKAEKIISEYKYDEKSAAETAQYAKMLTLIDNKDEAYKILKKAWDIDPNEFRIYDVLAQMAKNNKNVLLRDVIEIYKKYPDEKAYKVWLAKIYSLSKDTSESALGLIDKLSEDEEGKIALDIMKVSALHFSQKDDEAKKLLDNLLEENKDKYYAYHTAAWYYFNAKDYDKAEEYAMKSIELNDEYADNYGFLIPQITKKKQSKDGHKAYFRKAIELEPYNSSIMLQIANYWYSVNDKETALKYYEIAANLKPKDPEIKYTMAFIYIQKDDTDKAIELINESIELTKDDPIPKYHRTLGTIYMFKGEGEEAYKHIRAAYEADEYDILTLNNAGAYHMTLGDNVDLGFSNFTYAYQGMNDSYDKSVIETIEANFKKAEEFNTRFYDANDEELETPDFVLFY